MEIKGYIFNRRELSGALGDLGTFLPLAIALITINKVNAGSLFLAAGLLYIGAGLYYRIPIPVQPLKATSVIALAMAASPGMICATAISMGVIFLLASLFEIQKVLHRYFPRCVIRGIQLSLGLMLTKQGLAQLTARRLLANSAEYMITLGECNFSPGIIVGVSALGLIWVLRDNNRIPSGLTVVILGLSIGAWFKSQDQIPPLNFGLQALQFAIPTWKDFSFAMPVLLLPQLPLTFANSIMATDATAHQYFGNKAERVNLRSLIISLGVANLFSGLTGGMPMCHGSGGLTAHYRFGARSGGSSIIVGVIFILAALIFGQAIPFVFNLLPLAVLGALLIYNGISHALLIRDIISIPWELILALGMGIITMTSGGLAMAFILGLPLALLGERIKRGSWAWK